MKFRRSAFDVLGRSGPPFSSVVAALRDTGKHRVWFRRAEPDLPAADSGTPSGKSPTT